MMIRHDKKFWAVLMLMLAAAWPSPVVHAQESFFKGKQIRIVVGLSTGGGYDRAARLVSRYMGKYCPRQSRFRRAEHARRWFGYRRQLCLGSGQTGWTDFVGAA